MTSRGSTPIQQLAIMVLWELLAITRLRNLYTEYIMKIIIKEYIMKIIRYKITQPNYVSSVRAQNLVISSLF